MAAASPCPVVQAWSFHNNDRDDDEGVARGVAPARRNSGYVLKA
jgi:hypothetical protein